MSTVLEGLRYAESHEWVKAEGEFAYVGITDYAQHALGDIVYVDMPDVDDEVEKGEEFGAVESVKAASDLYSRIGRGGGSERGTQRRSGTHQPGRFCQLDYESETLRRL